MVSQTKLDHSFLIGQFIIDGFDIPCKVEWNANDGGIMLFVREDIPSKFVSVEISQK